MASDSKQLSLFGRVLSALPNWQRDTEVPGVQLYDRALFTAVLSLIGFGFVMVMSASMPEAQTLTGNPFYFMTRHVG